MSDSFQVYRLAESVPAASPPTLAKTAQGWGTLVFNGVEKKQEQGRSRNIAR